MDTQPQTTNVEVKDPIGFGFKIGIGIVLALVAIAAALFFGSILLSMLVYVAADSVSSATRASSTTSTESTISTETPESLTYDAIDRAVANHETLSDEQCAVIRSWIDRKMKADSKHWSPYYPTEQARQQRLDLPALVVGSVYHVQGHVEVNDTMNPDPEGDEYRRWSTENSDFQVLALEKSDGLLYYKVRVWLGDGTADKYAAASQFYYLKPTRVTRDELKRAGIR